MNFIFPIILGMSSSQLTHIFQTGGEKPPTSSCQILKHLGRSHLCPLSEVMLLSTTLQGPLAVKLGLEISKQWLRDLLVDDEIWGYRSYRPMLLSKMNWGL